MTAASEPINPKPDLSLYGIETQLLELMNFRDDVLSDPDMTPQEQKDSLDAIDKQVQEYITAEVKKCDGIARYLREFGARAATLKEEAKRCSEMAKAWEKRHDSLESMVISIMEQTGQKRIDGKHSVLSLRKNPPSVEVAQPDMVPGEYKRVTVTMPESLWNQVGQSLLLKDVRVAAALIDSAKVGAPEPMKQKIGEELKVGGSVPGCRLRTDGVRLEVK